jgi:hypothetical protein
MGSKYGACVELAVDSPRERVREEPAVRRKRKTHKVQEGG